MPKLLPMVLAGLPLLLLASTTALSGCGQGGVGPLGDPPPEVAAPPPRAEGVSALGRLEPEDGVIQVAAPSGEPAVIQQLLVDHGDVVEKGQLLATLDTVDVRDATVARLQAEYANAQRDLKRNLQLYEDKVLSDAQRDAWVTRVEVAKQELRRARAELVRARVRAPSAGQVLEVHARAGEQVGRAGILDLGRTDHMFAVAEVYEEDVGRVRLGQRARVTSPALPGPLTGEVDWIHLKVAKADALGTDPAARKDARVVEVEIRLDDSSAAAALTNLQVEIQIEP